MKSVGEIMLELGFDKEAPESTQKAFIKHLIKTAFPDQDLVIKKINQKSESKNQPIQLDLFSDFARVEKLNSKPKAKSKKVS